MKPNNYFKRELEQFSNEELIDFIRKGKAKNGDELFLAKRELKIRSILIDDYFDSDDNIDEFINFSNEENNEVGIEELVTNNNTSFGIKDLISLFVVLSILSIIIYFVSFYEPKTNYNKYNGISVGTITEIKEKTGIAQTPIGNYLTTSSYIVFYDFNVNKINYSDSMTIINNHQNFDFINYLVYQNNKEILIRYDTSNPRISVIDRDIE